MDRPLRRSNSRGNRRAVGKPPSVVKPPEPLLPPDNPSPFRPVNCAPLTLTRALADFPVGNMPLHAHQAAALAACPHKDLHHHPDAWLDAADLTILSPAGPRTLLAPCGTPLAWIGESQDPAASVTATTSFLIVHPWDLLRANERFVGALTAADIRGDIHPSAVIEGHLVLGPGSRVLPGVFVEGNVIIGANCKIGPNCYLRGATAIGDQCHIGQAVEIKNSLILSGTSIGHLSYVGDSIIGAKVNFGAGTIVSNLRHDGRNHCSLVGDSLVDTGRRKFGAIIGDGVHTGIHTSIYPGRKLWPGVSTRPGEIVRQDVRDG